MDAALAALALTPADHLVDYGCGEGGAVLAAARRYGCRATGYEIHAARAAAVAAVAAREPAEVAARVAIHARNALDADPTEPTAVYLYLIRRGLGLLTPFLRAAGAACMAATGAPLRVVTLLYAIPDVPPVRTLKVADPARPDIIFQLYLYTFGAAAEAPAAAEGAAPPPADAEISSGAEAAASGGGGGGGAE